MIKFDIRRIIFSAATPENLAVASLIAAIKCIIGDFSGIIEREEMTKQKYQIYFSIDNNNLSLSIDESSIIFSISYDNFHDPTKSEIHSSVARIVVIFYKLLSAINYNRFNILRVDIYAATDEVKSDYCGIDQKSKIDHKIDKSIKSNVKDLLLWPSCLYRVFNVLKDNRLLSIHELEVETAVYVSAINRDYEEEASLQKINDSKIVLFGELINHAIEMYFYGVNLPKKLGNDESEIKGNPLPKNANSQINCS